MKIGSLSVRKKRGRPLVRADVVVPGSDRVQVGLNLIQNSGLRPPLEDPGITGLRPLSEDSFLEGSEESLNSYAPEVEDGEGSSLADGCDVTLAHGFPACVRNAD